MSLQERSQDSDQPSQEHSARKRPVSERKIQANRQNALRSTGPTTARGKHNVSRNAIKHGILAREVVITAGDGEESLKEFHDLIEKFCEQYEPIGVVEESLVQTIATCWWRKARVLRAENGEMRKRLDMLTVDGMLRNSDKGNQDLRLQDALGCFRAQYQADPATSPTPKLSAMLDQCDLRGHYQGLAYLRLLLETAKSDIVSDGHVSKKIVEKIFFAFFLWDFLFALTCVNAGPPEGKMEDRRSEEFGDQATGKARPVVVAIAAIDHQLKRISAFEKYATERENLALDAEARSFSLPPADATDKLLRYEAHLDKQLYRAMDQLERLQRQRRGETVPPPLNINLGRAR
jgi:hypothetical protein